MSRSSPRAIPPPPRAFLRFEISHGPFKRSYSTDFSEIRRRVEDRASFSRAPASPLIRDPFSKKKNVRFKRSETSQRERHRDQSRDRALAKGFQHKTGPVDSSVGVGPHGVRLLVGCHTTHSEGISKFLKKGVEALFPKVVCLSGKR